MNPALAALPVAGAVTGVLLLRAAWSRRAGGWRMAAGWLCLIAGAPGWRLTGEAWDKAVVFAALAPSLAALAVLAGTAELRPARIRVADKVRIERDDSGAEPPRQAGPLWRGIAQAVLVGPVSGAAALGLAVALALRAPLGEADRLVAAAFLLPIAWAAGAIWATTDARLLRVVLTLAAIAGAAFGLAAA